ncbi:MAG: hypothetical protein ACM3JJ_03275 [Hyphomicrobiales bacterium]
MRRAGLAILLTLAAVATAGPAAAFDGQRRGFALEVGLGGGAIPAETLYPRGGYQDEVYRERSSLWTRFRAGVGLGDRWLLHYVNDVGWTKTDLQFDRNVLYATTSTGLGVTYFLRSAAPSLGFETGLGLSTSGAFQSGGGYFHRGSGPALWIGPAYEFAPGWIARATVGWAGVAEHWLYFGTEPDPNQTTAVGLTVGRAWY